MVPSVEPYPAWQMGKPEPGIQAPVSDINVKKREAMRLLQNLDTQALVRLSNKLENMGLIHNTEPSAQPQQRMPMNGAVGVDVPPPVMQNVIHAPQPPFPANASRAMGMAQPPMAPVAPPANTGLPMAFDYSRVSESHPLPPSLPVGALPTGALPTGALPIGMLPTGLVRHNNALPNTASAGYSQGLDLASMVDQGVSSLAPPAVPLMFPPSAAASQSPVAPPGKWMQQEEDSDQDRDAALHEDSTREAASANPQDETATTMILRNLPASFDQSSAQAWLDEKGFAEKYDFFLWFPAKSTSRLNGCGYAFVNFRRASDAQLCSKRLHLIRFEGDGDDDERLPLSIAVAKVQGFAENYARFQHLLEANTPTRCSPFFAQDSIDALSQTELMAIAQSAAANAQPTHADVKGPVTTIVIRNLPSMIESTDSARQWLDTEGYGNLYDFFLFLPAKRQRRVNQKSAPAPQGFGYAFVNFKKAADAERCGQALNGKVFGDGTPALNIVTAKVQGHAQCIEHFSSLSESGRCTPWIEPEQEKLQESVPRPARTVFQ